MSSGRGRSIVVFIFVCGLLPIAGQMANKPTQTQEPARPPQPRQPTPPTPTTPQPAPPVAQPAPPPPTPPSPPATGVPFQVKEIWSSNFETGDLSQWYWPDSQLAADAGGGEFTNGNASTAVTTDVAHSGRYSAKLTISAPPIAATRLFRWRESQAIQTLYYSAWYYFPQTYVAKNFWNVWQWKSKIASTGTDDPFFILNVGTRPDGNMYLFLFDWQTRATYSQTQQNIPVQQWVHIEAEYVCAADNQGRVTVWQSGTLLFQVAGFPTRYSNGDCQWSVNNYSDSIQPSPAYFYVDDASIGIPIS